MAQKIDSTILIVDDDEDVRTAARLLLKQSYKTVLALEAPSRIPGVLQEQDVDVILLDMNFEQDATSGKEGFHWLKRILEIDPSIAVIMTTAFGGVEVAVRAIKEGAADFALKPWQNEKLLASISAAANLHRSRRQVQELEGRQQLLQRVMDEPFSDIIGDSPAMETLFDVTRKAAATDANVLILGENGTGKELIARALHRGSKRDQEPFITVDMGTINESLFESELFGHKKGAFTDAKTNRIGRFQAASGGTLFLDEVGNLPLALQAKLLTAIQKREITPVGGNKPIPVDLRLICATNMPLYDMVDAQTFRQDLLYRINTIEIRLPPLRERGDDIPMLVDHYLEIYTRKYQVPPKQISTETLQRLRRYHWPGNVRELQHAVERAVIMSDRRVMQPEDFLLAREKERDDRDALVLDDFNLATAEKAIIHKVMEKHDGNISKAAKELGLTRTSLYRRLERYEIS